MPRDHPLERSCFNPRSHPRVRATSAKLMAAIEHAVSIHARTRGCERHCCPGRDARKNEFQSTLAPEGASDIVIQDAMPDDVSFNPRSHPRVRATINLALSGRLTAVSIHARTRGCERRTLGTMSGQTDKFQSTLAPEGASDRPAPRIRRPAPRFNPRSHPRVRATMTALPERIQSGVSIHARTRGCERLCWTRRILTINQFQSTLAPEGASDRRCADMSFAAIGFQSTLAPEGASDLAGMHLPSGLGDVSIHARTRGCERLCVKQFVFGGGCVSIHARTRGCERPLR